MSVTVPSAAVTLEHNMMIPSEFLCSPDESTFCYQDKLPALPVPKLDNTIQAYLDSVKVHISEEEYKHTELLCKQFEQGVGKTLHEKLVEKAATQRNWMEKWWLDKAYLETRAPLAPYCNFTGPGPEYKLEEGKQVENLSMTVWYMLQYHKLATSERLFVEKAGGKKAFDMDQIRHLFNTCRNPGETIDSIRCVFKTEREGQCPNHAVVLCRGYIYQFDCYHPDGTILTVPELKQQLDYIQKQCESKPHGPGLGALTSEKRDVWFQLREHLKTLHPDNARYLDSIEQSLFAVALDDARPLNKSQQSHAGMCGDSRNRWFDKSCTTIGFKNGASSCNCDHTPYEALTVIHEVVFLKRAIALNNESWMHTPFDGLTAVHLLQYEIRGTTNGVIKWLGTNHIRPMRKPIELPFHLDARIHAGIQDAVKQFNQNSSQIEVYNPIFTEFGKKALKRARMHPDSFVQICLQLAYYRLHKRFAPTYETGTARLFWHGRTETVRTCTNEVANFCKAIDNPAVTDVDKIKLLDESYNKHVSLMSEALQFKGCDRHLLGLYCLAMEEGMELPEIYTDPAFVKSGGGGNFVLSTSCVGYYAIHGGMAPMKNDGYGFFYSIQDNSFRPFISCYKTDGETDCSKLYDSLSQSFRDIKALLDLKVSLNTSATGAKL